MVAQNRDLLMGTRTSASHIDELVIWAYQKWGWVPPPGMLKKKENTPEMNEIERDKKILKIWAYNFEKQKS